MGTGQVPPVDAADNKARLSGRSDGLCVNLSGEGSSHRPVVCIPLGVMRQIVTATSQAGDTTSAWP